MRLKALGVFFNVALVAPACWHYSDDQNRRTVLAQNNDWIVTAIGPLHTTGTSFGWESTINVRFEAKRNGKPYAQGHLYEAGPHDDSFDVAHPRRDWVAPNAVRFWRSTREDYAFTIVLRNESSREIRWLRIRTGEVFLAFAIPPNGAVRLPSLWRGQYGFRVSGEFTDGAPMREAFESPLSLPSRRTEIVIRDTGTSIR